MRCCPFLLVDVAVPLKLHHSASFVSWTHRCWSWACRAVGAPSDSTVWRRHKELSLFLMLLGHSLAWSKYIGDILSCLCDVTIQEISSGTREWWSLRCIHHFYCSRLISNSGLLTPNSWNILLPYVSRLLIAIEQTHMGPTFTNTKFRFDSPQLF